MLHILFLILKIIGIILLSLLGLLFVVLSVVLFIPVRYRVDVNNKTVRAKAHWFLHLISAYFIYDGTKSDWQVRFAWRKLNNDKEDTITETTDEVADEGSENAPPESTETKNAYKKRKKKSKKRTISKFKCTIQKICDKIKKLWETKERIKEFIADPVHRNAFRRIKKEIKLLARRIRPKKLDGFVRFGMEDPYNTGQILAALSVLYPFYGECIRIYPDFENKVFEGEIHLRGSMHVVTFIVLLWNLFFDKNIRITYQDYKKLKP